MPRVSEEKKPPVVKVRSQGRINKVLDSIAKNVEAANPGKKTMWVYAPEHKPELSRVMEKKVDGYTFVGKDQVPEDFKNLIEYDSTGHIRVADVVLMMVDVTIYKEKVNELLAMNAAQLESTEQKFYSAQDQHTSNLGGQARGRAIIETREEEVDLTQRSNTDGNS